MLGWMLRVSANFGAADAGGAAGAALDAASKRELLQPCQFSIVSSEFDSHYSEMLINAYERASYVDCEQRYGLAGDACLQHTQTVVLSRL